MRCVKTPDSASAASLKVGDEYPVLEINYLFEGGFDYRLIPSLGLYPPELFEVSDASVPEIWTVSVIPDVGITIAPGAWQLPGFWERYFDQDHGAVELFKAEALKFIERHELEKVAFPLYMDDI